MRRIALAVTLLTIACGPLLGQSGGTGSGRSVEGPLGCFCTSLLEGGSLCIQDYFCEEAPQGGIGAYCDAQTPCGQGTVCATNECCEQSPTAGRCTTACPDGPCTNEGICGPGACLSTIVAVPTLSTYGIAALAVILTLGGVWFLRRRFHRA